MKKTIKYCSLITLVILVTGCSNKASSIESNSSSSAFIENPVTMSEFLSNNDSLKKPSFKRVQVTVKGEHTHSGEMPDNLYYPWEIYHYEEEGVFELIPSSQDGKFYIFNKISGDSCEHLDIPYLRYGDACLTFFASDFVGQNLDEAVEEAKTNNTFTFSYGLSIDPIKVEIKQILTDRDGKFKEQGDYLFNDFAYFEFNEYGYLLKARLDASISLKNYSYKDKVYNGLDEMHTDISVEYFDE